MDSLVSYSTTSKVRPLSLYDKFLFHSNNYGVFSYWCCFPISNWSCWKSTWFQVLAICVQPFYPNKECFPPSNSSCYFFSHNNWKDRCFLPSSEFLVIAWQYVQQINVNVRKQVTPISFFLLQRVRFWSQAFTMEPLCYIHFPYSYWSSLFSQESQGSRVLRECVITFDALLA